MAKVILFAFLLNGITAIVSGAPAEQYGSPIAEYELDSESLGQVNDGLVRIRRFTCDVLSAGNWFQDSACATNCIRLGKLGGHCSEGVCRCR